MISKTQGVAVAAGAAALSGCYVEHTFGADPVCWEGPDICEPSRMIVGGCDERSQGPTEWGDEVPWRSVGKLTPQGCTGTLITASHVLTAAHCLLDGNNALSSPEVGFRLGQHGADAFPYGTHYVERAYIPAAYDNALISESNKIYDYAVLELQNPIPDAQPMTVAAVGWNDITTRPLYSVGYPYDLPNEQTGGNIAYGTYGYHQGHSTFAEGALIKADIDGAGGQSGSPVYQIVAGPRRLVGVLIGSPVPVCETEAVTWSPKITDWTIGHVTGPAIGVGSTADLRIEEYPSVPADTPPSP